MPTVRQLHWPGLIPQAAAIGLIAVTLHLCFPTLLLRQDLLIAAGAYLIVCRILRATLTRDHILGMRAYRASRFKEAISHYEASYQFFSTHRRLDAWRSLLLGVASANPYRVIALGNMAYSYGQLGDGNKAIELYVQVLREAPDHTLAKASLQMLRAVPRPAEARIPIADPPAAPKAKEPP
jgi:tetratricopeptide (TPR) repeat protein